jgi:carboxyl-terminal processing protease
LILDLRDNAGGLLDAAVGTCSLFLNEGTIVTIRGRDGEVHRTFEAGGTALLDDGIPLTVLINHFSASASEIVAACLQDHQRATVIGQRTWGKGTVQNVIPIESGNAALKLTTASYWRPSGKNIHRLKDAPDEDEWGVRPDPDFEVKLTDEQASEVRQRRHQKDTGAKPKTDPGKAPDEAAAQPLDDPQLRRAVEYLQQQLNKIGPKA